MVTFNFTYDPGVTIRQALGFEMAGRIWSHYLSDPVTLNIHIGISNALPTNVIGGALPGLLANVSYETFRGHLQQDATSDNDNSAALPAGSSFSANVFLLEQTPDPADSILHTQSFSTDTLNVTRAGAKAVGLIPGNSATLDGAIVMSTLANSQFQWNYNFTRNTTATTGSLDFLSVALHEIGHLLGFVSGVDKPVTVIPAISAGNQEQALEYWQSIPERMLFTTPLDLFRIDFSGQKNMTYGYLVSDTLFAPQGTGGIAAFSTGKDALAYGDGFQASHWAEWEVPLGIMDPAIAPRERASISNIDLQAFDAIGWNLRNGLTGYDYTPTPTSSFTTTFLNNIRTQAVSALARRLGQTTTWINSNLTTAPTTLGRDRTVDVEAMIRNSLVYEWGTTGSGTTSTSGRRWMEIFNQMASAQEVYVNFSTVSTVTPTETDAGNEGADRHQGDFQNPNQDDAQHSTEPTWGNLGPGQIGKGPRGWAAPDETSELPTDQLSGFDSGSQLVGRGLDSFPNPGQVSLMMTSDPLSTNNSTVAAVQWNPIATRMSETAATSEISSGTVIGSRQQVAPLFSTGLDSLLGVENNPLAQGSLSMGVMGAIA